MRSDIRVIIADDEALYREWLRVGIPLKQNGYEIVGEAEDGEEVLALCEQLKPDIVITDIVMPRMDGLELTRKLQEKWPRIKVILLSSYQEFEFARKALSYGATGYMLKVSSGYQELLSLLDQARQAIETDRVKLFKEMNDRYYLQQHIPLLRKQFITDIINRNLHSSEDIYQQFSYLNMNPPSSGLSMVIIQIDHYYKVEGDYNSRDISLFKYTLMHMVEELTNLKYCGNVFHWNEQQFALLIHSGSPLNSSINQMSDAKLEVLFKDILMNVRIYLPFSVSISCSSYQEIQQGQAYPTSLKAALRGTMDEVLWTVKERFYSGHGSINFHERKQYTVASNQYLQQFKDELLSINLASKESAGRMFIREKIIHVIQQQRFDPLDMIQWLKQLTSDWVGSTSADHAQMIERVDAVECLEDIEPFLYHLVLWRNPIFVTVGRDNLYREEIQDALIYISAHYHDPLSISDICEQIVMSPNYFSHLFKRETGMNFSDYVTIYRVEQAKRLLYETTLQIQEIAERVGIPDYKYFARLFRRTTGQTPGGFREDYR